MTYIHNKIHYLEKKVELPKAVLFVFLNILLTVSGYLIKIFRKEIIYISFL